jgi:hypothetical protein
MQMMRTVRGGNSLAIITHCRRAQFQEFPTIIALYRVSGCLNYDHFDCCIDFYSRLNPSTHR